MAKGKEDFSFDDNDWGDDFDFMEDEGGGYNAPPKSSGRQVVDGLAGGFVSGVKDTLKSEETQTRFIKEALPDGYSTIYSGLSTAGRATSDLYREVGTEFTKVNTALKDTTRKILPRIKNQLPKRMARKLESYAGPGKNNYGHNHDYDSMEIDSALSDIFGMPQENPNQVAKAPIRSRGDIVGITKSIVESKLQGDAVSGINGLLRLATKRDDYFDNIGMKLERKKIEIAYRQLFAQTKMLDVAQQQLQLSRVAYDAIIKNTAMPEIIKEHESEKLKDVMRKRFYGKVTEDVSDRFAGIVNKAKETAIGKVKDSVSTFVELLSMGAEVLDSQMALSEAESEMDDMDGPTLTEEQRAKRNKVKMYAKMAEMGGSTMGSVVTAKLAHKMSRFTRDKFGSDERLIQAGAAGANFFDNAGQYTQQWARSHNTGISGAIASLLGIEEMAEYAQNPKIQSSMIDHLDQRASWNLRNDVTLTKIIPSLMGLIHNEIRMMRTGDNTLEPLKYSFEKDSFIDKRAHRQRIAERVLSNKDTKDTAEALDETYKEVDKDGKLSYPAQRELKKYLLNQARTSTGGIDLRQLISFSSPITGAEGDEVREFIKSEYGINEYDTINDGSSRLGNFLDNDVLNTIRADMSRDVDYQRRIRDLRGKQNNLRSIVPKDFENALSIAQNEDLEALRELGFVVENQNIPGQWDFNFDAMNNRLIDGDEFSDGFNPVNPPGGLPPSGPNPGRQRKRPKSPKPPRSGGGRPKPPPAPPPSGPASISGTVNVTNPLDIANPIISKLNDMQLQLINGISSFQPPPSPFTGPLPPSLQDTVTTEATDTDRVISAINAIHERMALSADQSSLNTTKQFDYMDQIMGLLAAGIIPTGEIGDTIRQAAAGDALSSKSWLTKGWRKTKSSGWRALKIAGRTLALPVTATKSLVGGAASLTGDAIKGSWGLLTKTNYSKLGGKGLDNIQDTYVKGREGIALFANRIHEGQYVDVSTGKVIKSLRDITGEVHDKSGNVVITAEEFKEGLYTKGRRGFELIKGLAKGGIGLVKGVSSIAAAPYKAVKMLWNAATWAKNLFTYVRDIYVVGEDQPRLLATVFNNGGYISATTGKIITKLKHIIGGVKSPTGEVILTQSDMAKGLVYANGSEVKIGGQFIRKLLSGTARLASGAVVGSAKLAFKIAAAPAKAGIKLAKWAGKGAFGWLSTGARKLLGLKSNGASSDASQTSSDPQLLSLAAQQTDYLRSIFDVLSQRLPEPKAEIATGSAMDKWLKEQAEDAKVKPTATPKEKEEKKSSGFSGMLLSLLGGIGSAIMGFGSKALKYLKIISLAKAAGGFLGGPGGAAPGRGRMGGIVRGLGMATAGLAGYSLYNSSNASESQTDENGNPVPGSEEGGTSMLGTAASMLGGMAAWDVGTRLLTKDGRASLKNGAKSVGKGLGSVGRGIANAGRFVGRQALWAGARTALIAGGTALAGVLSAPVLIGAAAVGAVALGGYLLYKHTTRKEDVLLNFRMNQYGFKESDDKRCSKIIALEKLLIPAIRMSNGKATLGNGVKTETVLALFSVDKTDSNAVEKFSVWFNRRFKPIFLGWVTNYHSIKGNLNLHEADQKLTRDERQSLLRSSHITDGGNNSPYVVAASPFNGDDEVKLGFAAINKKYKSSYATLGKIKDYTSEAKERDKMDKAKWSDSTKQGLEDQKKAEEEAATRAKNSKFVNWLNDTSKSVVEGAKAGYQSAINATSRGIEAVANAGSSAVKFAKSKLSGSSKEKFNSVRDAALKAGDPHPEVVAAQFALESAWGRSESGKYNYFGIKARGNEPGTVKKTWEVRNGVRKVEYHKFRDYDSLEDGIAGRVEFTKVNKRYTKSGYYDAKTPLEAAQALKNGKYATDPKYVQKLASIISGAGYDPNKPSGDANDQLTATQDAQPKVVGGSGGGGGGGEVVTDALNGKGVPKPKGNVDVAAALNINMDKTMLNRGANSSAEKKSGFRFYEHQGASKSTGVEQATVPAGSRSIVPLRTGQYQINIVRKWQNAKCTISQYSVEGTGISGYFLENPGPSTTTANQRKRIPTGTYQVAWHNGSRFKGVVVLFNESVRRDRSILIHKGNLPKHTDGCLLPGKETDRSSKVTRSGEALNELLGFIKQVNVKNVRIVITESFGASDSASSQVTDTSSENPATSPNRIGVESVPSSPSVTPGSSSSGRSIDGSSRRGYDIPDLPDGPNVASRDTPRDNVTRRANQRLQEERRVAVDSAVSKIQQDMLEQQVVTNNKLDTIIDLIGKAAQAANQQRSTVAPTEPKKPGQSIMAGNQGESIFQSPPVGFNV